MFLSETTRPDIASAVNLLSQACKRPSVQDFIAEKRVLRYLKGKNYTLTYSRYDNGLCFFLRPVMPITYQKSYIWHGYIIKQVTLTGAFANC